MEKQKFQTYFLIVILTIAAIIAFFIFQPFLLTIILAMIFAVVFEPFHRRIGKLVGNRPRLTALLTVLVVLLVIFVPLVFFGIQILREAGQLYSFFLTSGGVSNLSSLGNSWIDKIQGFLPNSQRIVFNFDLYLKQGLEWLLQNTGFIFSNITKIMMSLIIFIFALYYFIKEGPMLRKLILRVSPLMEVDNETILEKLRASINSVVRGTLLFALIQGILVAIGFAIFGIPNAILWGTIAIMAALVPFIGPALIIIPGIVFLFLVGQFYMAIGLLIWGVLILAIVNNILGPRLMGKGMKLNPLIVLLSVLGGLSLFGPIGFLIGPLIISLLFTLVDIYFLRKNP